MGQYNERVEKQRITLAAEEWARGVKCLHAHSVSSMHYDDRPQDTNDGKYVTDVEYNDGSVCRTLSNGEIVTLGKALKGQDLLDAYTTFN